MAAKPLGFFEKIANLAGVVYRYHARQWPRRYAIISEVLKKEVAPPSAADLPAIKKEWGQIVRFIETKQYNQLSVREGLVYGAVVLEISFWFFVGEIIGRRHIAGYLVPGDYVSKDTRKQAANYVPEDKGNF